MTMETMPMKLITARALSCDSRAAAWVILQKWMQMEGKGAQETTHKMTARGMGVGVIGMVVVACGSWLAGWLAVCVSGRQLV